MCADLRYNRHCRRSILQTIQNYRFGLISYMHALMMLGGFVQWMIQAMYTKYPNAIRLCSSIRFFSFLLSTLEVPITSADDLLVAAIIQAPVGRLTCAKKDSLNYPCGLRYWWLCPFPSDGKKGTAYVEDRAAPLRIWVKAWRATTGSNTHAHPCQLVLTVISRPGNPIAWVTYFEANLFMR